MTEIDVNELNGKKRTECIVRALALACAREMLAQYYYDCMKANGDAPEAQQKDSAAYEYALEALKELYVHDVPSGRNGWPALPDGCPRRGSLEMHRDALALAFEALADVFQGMEDKWSCHDDAVEQVLVRMSRVAFDAGASTTMAVPTPDGVLEVERVVMGRIPGTSKYILLNGEPFDARSSLVH